MIIFLSTKSLNMAASSVLIISLIGACCCAISNGYNISTKPEYDLVIGLSVNGILWKQEMLNWPEGQSLNLTCLVQKRYKKDSSVQPSDYTIRIPFSTQDPTNLYSLNWNL